MRRRAFGNMADNPPHRENEKAAEEQNRSNDEDMAPSQLAQKAQRMTCVAHDAPLPKVWSRCTDTITIRGTRWSAIFYFEQWAPSGTPLPKLWISLRLSVPPRPQHRLLIN